MRKKERKKEERKKKGRRDILNVVSGCARVGRFHGEVAVKAKQLRDKKRKEKKKRNEK